MLIKNGYVTEHQHKGQSTKTEIRNLKNRITQGKNMMWGKKKRSKNSEPDR